jgi:hypothetical protein
MNYKTLWDYLRQSRRSYCVQFIHRHVAQLKLCHVSMHHLHQLP